jgi:hypothetical protein
MKLTYISRFAALAALAFSAVSCTDLLNLEPQQSISENLALSSDANVKAVLVGAYDAISDGDLYGGNLLKHSELLGGDGEIFWVGTFNAPREIANKQINVTNGDVLATWSDAYVAINLCNNVLDALSVVNAEDRPRVQGEALFLRSALFFELVRLYAPQYSAANASAPGIPLVLTPTRGISEASNVARNTVGEVYDRIEADLEEAEGLLPVENDFFANSAAAAALLARVHLQRGDYALARDAANRVINSGLYALLPDYADCFNNGENTVEDIFAIQVNTQDGVNWMNLFYSIPAFGGRDGDIEIEDDHLALYDSADARLALFFEGAGATRTGKWNNQFGNVNIIRLAEMHLIRAEGNQRLSTATGATPLDDYNEIRTRAGLPAATSVSLDDILLERRRELAHEGVKIHDMRRLGTPVGPRSADDPKLVFPIPQREIEANPNMTQNNGY